MASSTNYQEFTAKLGAWADKLLPAQLTQLSRAATQNLWEQVHADTPVVDGHLRGSWQAQIGTLPPLSEDRVTPGKEPDSFNRVAFVINQMQGGDRIFFVNNAAYAMRIEYGFNDVDSLGRRYNQAGQYFVTRNGARWQQFVDEAASSLRFT